MLVILKFNFEVNKMLSDPPYNLRLFKTLNSIGKWDILVIKKDPVKNRWHTITYTDIDSLTEEIYVIFSIYKTKTITKKELKKLIQQELINAPDIVCSDDFITSAGDGISVSSKFDVVGSSVGSILVLYNGPKSQIFYTYDAIKLKFSNDKQQLRSRFSLTDDEIPNFIDEFNKMVD